MTGVDSSQRSNDANLIAATGLRSVRAAGFRADRSESKKPKHYFALHVLFSRSFFAGQIVMDEGVEAIFLDSSLGR